MTKTIQVCFILNWFEINFTFCKKRKRKCLEEFPFNPLHNGWNSRRYVLFYTGKSFKFGK